MSGLLPVLAAMTALAAAALLWPLFARRSVPARSGFELSVYRDQLAEVERDRARGLIGEAEARAARLEIERRILRAAPPAAEGGPGTEPAARAGDGRYVLVAAALVPALALGLYGVLGSPGLPDRPLASRQDRGPADPTRPDIREMVARLEARLRTAPDDLEGWLMLGRSQGALDDPQGSVAAYRRAQALAPEDPRVLGALAESLIVLGSGVVTPEARNLLERLGAKDTADPRVDFYLGWAAAQAGDYQPALDRWRRLLAATPGDAPWRPRLVEAVRQAAQELKLDPDAVVAQIPTPPPAAAVAAAPATAAAPAQGVPGGPSPEEVARAAAMPPEERQAMVRGMVDKLQARLDAGGGDATGWVRLAQARLVLGEPDRARSAFEQGLKLYPTEPDLMKGLAGALLGPVRPDTGLPEIGDRAAGLYARAAELRPDDPEAWWYLGIRALQDGKKGDARASWEKVLARLDPSQPEYAEIKDRLQRLGG